MRVAVLVVSAMVAHSSVAAGQPSGRAANAAAEKRIRARLHADPGLQHDEINVRVRDGVATLRGRVDSQSERAKAEELSRVEGVVRVEDHLQGGRSHGRLQTLSDATTSMKLKTQYMNDQALKGQHIAVTTTDGVVTLFGSVPSDQARRRALDFARGTAGVKDVTDKLTIVHP
jgi:hyperosmotically inducible protein